MSINEKLFALQTDIGAIAKNSNNPFYNSKYFDINDMLDTLKPYLKEHGLLLMQPIESGHVVSRLIDVESGDAYESSMQLPSITDPQKIGSAITYYRRYTLQSLLALQAEDDDGNTASKAKQGYVLTPDKPRWEKAVHAVASGKSSIEEVKKIVTISDEDAERLVMEAMEFAND